MVTSVPMSPAFVQSPFTVTRIRGPGAPRRGGRGGGGIHVAGPLILLPRSVAQRSGFRRADDGVRDLSRRGAGEGLAQDGGDAGDVRRAEAGAAREADPAGR